MAKLDFDGAAALRCGSLCQEEIAAQTRAALKAGTYDPTHDPERMGRATFRRQALRYAMQGFAAKVSGDDREAAFYLRMAQNRAQYKAE